MPIAMAVPIAPYARPRPIAPSRSPRPRYSAVAGSGWTVRTTRISPIPSVYQASRRMRLGARPQRSTSSYSAALNRSASKRSRTSRPTRPTDISTRSQSGTSPMRGRPARSRSISRPSAHERDASGVAHAEDREEGLLRNLHRPHPLHPLLPFLLLLEQLALAADVATVALRQDVLAHGADGLARHDVAPDRRLDGHLEHLARDQLLQLVGELAARRLRPIPVDDEAQRVDGLAVHQDVELHEVGRAVPRLLVVHRCVALGPALELVVVVDDQLRERELEVHVDALRVQVLHVLEAAAATRRELHEAADVPVRGHHAELDPRLLDRLDLADVRELRRIVHVHPAAVHRQLHPVLDGRGARDEVQVELALQALLDDLHVEQAEEAAAEPEAEGDR